MSTWEHGDEFYLEDGTPIRCNCSPARAPIIVRGDAMNVMMGVSPARLTRTLGEAVLEYVATCSEWPGGCGWIEGTYILPGYPVAITSAV